MAKKTKIIMSARTKKVSHNPASKHVVKKGKGGKRKAHKMTVKVKA